MREVAGAMLDAANATFRHYPKVAIPFGYRRFAYSGVMVVWVAIATIHSRVATHPKRSPRSFVSRLIQNMAVIFREANSSR